MKHLPNRPDAVLLEQLEQAVPVSAGVSQPKPGKRPLLGKFDDLGERGRGDRHRLTGVLDGDAHLELLYFVVGVENKLI